MYIFLLVNTKERKVSNDVTAWHVCYLLNLMQKRLTYLVYTYLHNKYVENDNMQSLMRHTVVFSMCIIFSVGKDCGPAEYLTDAGECCPMCGEGSAVHRDCTSDSSTSCIPCIPGRTYTDEPNGLSKCLQCKTCDSGQGLIFRHKCTTTSNAFCDVEDGFYCGSYSKNKECNFAIKHSTCDPGEYLKAPGTKTADTQCEECADGYFSAYGINCTAWTKCNVDQLRTAEGTKTTDTVCEDIPKRNKSVIVAPLSLAGVVVAALCGMYITEGRKNRLKIPIQETLGHQRKDGLP